MALQTWCFSFRGRLGRRDLWIWLMLWFTLMVLLFAFAARGWLAVQTAAFCVVCLLWPTGAVVVKRLHDRNKAGYWALLLIVAWILLAGDWHMLSPRWQWSLGRFLPTLILVVMTLELGAFRGSVGENRFGKAARPVNYFGRSTPDYQ